MARLIGVDLPRDKRLEVTLGSGSGQIRLETFSGDIEIRKP